MFSIFISPSFQSINQSIPPIPEKLFEKLLLNGMTSLWHFTPTAAKKKLRLTSKRKTSPECYATGKRRHSKHVHLYDKVQTRQMRQENSKKRQSWQTVQTLTAQVPELDSRVDELRAQLAAMQHQCLKLETFQDGKYTDNFRQCCISLLAHYDVHHIH